MKTPEEYEQKIADLLAMNSKLKTQLTKALEALCELHKTQTRKAA